MNTVTPIHNIPMKARVPLKDYKGILLKLTPKDEEKIAVIRKEVDDYLFEAAKLESAMIKMPICTKRDYYEKKVLNLRKLVEACEIIIKNIKIERLNKQKAEAAKKLDTTI